MEGAAADLRAYLGAVLGRWRMVGDRSWGHRASTVWQVWGGDGVAYVVKRHSDSERYRAELTAYQHWVPALGECAPRLRGHDDQLGVLVLSALRGKPISAAARQAGHARDPALHHRAGALLRHLHDAQPASAWTNFASDQRQELDRWLAQGRGLLSASEVDFARAQVASLVELGQPQRVACHLDYGPRNWLLDDGVLRVIDFEWARRHVWVSDLAGLYFGPWRRRPDLQEAFLDGYERTIEAEDRALLRGYGALRAVWLITRGHRYGEAALEEANRQVLHRLMAERAHSRT